MSSKETVAPRLKRPYYLHSRSRSGEIGIRTRLKIWRGHTHVGSSPTSGTITLESQLEHLQLSHRRGHIGSLIIKSTYSLDFGPSILISSYFDGREDAISAMGCSFCVTCYQTNAGYNTIGL